MLRRRLSRRRLAHARVQQIALSDGGGDALLYLGTFAGDSRIYPHRDQTGALPISTSTLDRELSSARATPRLVKIDVQGAEVRVLRGMSTVLHRPDPPLLLVELWPEGLAAARSSADELFGVTGAAGMRPARLAEDGTLVVATPAELVSRCAASGYLDMVFLTSASRHVSGAC